MASYAQLIEAEVTRGQLVSAGIRAALRDEHTVGAHPMLGLALGGVKVLVSETDLDRAREVLTLASGGSHRAFRVEQSSSLIYALLGGAAGALIGALLRVVLGGAWVLLLGAAVGLVAGALMGRRKLAYCSRCSAGLTAENRSCPGCEAQIVGVIDDPEDRLAAEERLKAAAEPSLD